MEPLRRIARYADLAALPEGARAEIVDGQIVTHPAPMPRHAKPQGALRSFIGAPFDDDDGFGGPGGWWVFVEVEVELGPNVLRPDLTGWRRERLSEPDVRPIAIVPDWIGEVLSDSNRAYDRVTKRRIYAEQGVAHYWIVDPEDRTLEALKLDHGQWVEVGSFDETETVRIPPFESIELPIRRLFLPKSQEAPPR